MYDMKFRPLLFVVFFFAEFTHGDNGSKVNVHCNTSKANAMTDANVAHTAVETTVCYTVSSRLEGNFLWQPILTDDDPPVIHRIDSQSYDLILQQVKNLNSDARLPTIKELSSIVAYSDAAPFIHYQRITDWLADTTGGVILSSTYQSDDDNDTLEGWLGVEILSGNTVIVDVWSNTHPLYALSLRESSSIFTASGFRIRNIISEECVEKSINEGDEDVVNTQKCQLRNVTSSSADVQTWFYNVHTGQLKNEHDDKCAYATATATLSVAKCSPDNNQKWDYVNRAFYLRSDPTKTWKSTDPIEIVERDSFADTNETGETTAAAVKQRSWDLYYPQ
jgi:ribosomal protein L31